MWFPQGLQNFHHTPYDVRFDLMFPDPQDGPAHSTELAVVPVVSLAIFFDLAAPLVREPVPPDRQPPAVPEVTVDKDGELLRAEHEIGPTWQIPRMAVVVNVAGFQQGVDVSLGCRIGSPDP